MPYINQFANYHATKKMLSEKSFIKELEDISIPDLQNFYKEFNEKLDSVTLNVEQFDEIDTVWAIDGTDFVEEISKFPYCEYGIVSVGCVKMDLKEWSGGKKDIVPFNLYSIIPGARLSTYTAKDGFLGLRKKINNILKEAKFDFCDDSLLDIYERIMEYNRDDFKTPLCPNIMNGCNELMKVQAGEYVCNCGTTVYSTDLLRLHEIFEHNQSNQGIYTTLMAVLEKLTLLVLINYYRDNDMHEDLTKTAFALDGTLAFYNQVSWLSTSFNKALLYVNNELKVKTGKQLTIFSIEKSGRFFDHFKALNDKKIRENNNWLKNKTIVIDDEYIKKYIITSSMDAKSQYGDGTYFGRKFFFSNKFNYNYIVNVPFYGLFDREDLTKSKEKHFHELGKINFLLNKLASLSYNDSFIPIIFAHEETSISNQDINRKIINHITKIK